MDKSIVTKCLRCGGAVSYDKFYSVYGQFWGWRCLICGEIVDPVILENRESMRAAQGMNLPGDREAIRR